MAKFLAGELENEAGERLEVLLISIESYTDSSVQSVCCVLWYHHLHIRVNLNTLWTSNSLTTRSPSFAADHAAVAFAWRAGARSDRSDPFLLSIRAPPSHSSDFDLPVPVPDSSLVFYTSPSPSPPFRAPQSPEWPSTSLPRPSSMVSTPYPISGL